MLLWPALLAILRGLVAINWLLVLLIKYYPEDLPLSKPTPDLADKGLGVRVAYPIPLHIWDRFVPDSLLLALKSFVPPPPYQTRPIGLTALHVILSLKQDSFPVPFPSNPDFIPDDNLSVSSY